MKKFLFTIATVLLVLSLKAETIEKTYFFSNYNIVESGDYQIISFKNTLITGKAGEPALPYQAVTLLLPPGEIAESIEFIGEQEIQIPGYFHLYPQQHSQPISLGDQKTFVKNTGVYQTNAQYPASLTGKLSTEFMNGYSFAISTFTPLKYNPVTGEVSFYKKVTIRIKTTKNTIAEKALENLSSLKNVLKKINSYAQNAGYISLYPVKENKGDDYQMMIITPSQFENNYQDIIDLYFIRGIKVEIVTKEYINSNISGQDLQEKIRNYIIQEYQAHNVEYVLLGGDVEHIPYRGFYCYVQSGSGYEDNSIPADLYYSALDGTWNDDGDNSWGEIGEDDLLPEIAVARFTISNTSDLNNMMNKTVSYQDNPVTGELRDPILAGEHLWSSPETWGADYLDLLIGYHEDNGYTTDGIPEDHNIETLYERDGYWSGSTLIAKINQGKSFIHHCGHASEMSVMHLGVSDITNSNFSQVNGVIHNYTLAFSHGCNCGSFDYNDCIMERMVNIENFAAAVIANSRYGWFNEGQTEGPAAHLHREFVDALYYEKINRIGAAFVETKIQTAPWVIAPGQWEEGALRWNFYDINIMGDPAMAIWTDEPITIQATYQNAIPIGVPFTNVSVTSNGNPMENFRCVIIKDNIIHGVGITNGSGNAEILFDPPFTSVGNAELIISGNNCLPTSFPVNIIPNTGSYVIYTSHQINDLAGNGNGLVDYGESILLSLDLTNVGAQQASNVIVTLSTNDNYITITDNTENYGNIPGGGTVSVENAFAFDVASNIPDNHIINFDLEIVADDTWNSNFSITVFAPELTIGNLTINDVSNGNGNGILDPGEIADIIIKSSNFGHSDCFNATGTLITSNTNITITNPTYDLGTIAQGETKDAIFSVSVDPSTPVGTSIDLFNNLVSGEYSVDNTFYTTIGIILEDFETGNFSAFDWNFGGNASWTICNDNPYEGVYCAKSGDISDQQTSEMNITLDVLTNDSISFFRKVSSESNYDFLKFYIDNTLKAEWSGEESWAKVCYYVSQGTHTFKWEYNKDWNTISGSDCAWVDYIVFPPVESSQGPLTVAVSANPSEICYGSSSQLYAVPSGGTGNYTYSWTPTTGLNNSSIYNPVASPETTTTYTVTVNDGTDNISADVTVYVNPVPPTPSISQIDNYLVSSSETGNQWYNSNGLISGATSQVYYPTATDNYYVIVTNEFGCSSEQSNIIYFIYTGYIEIQNSKGLDIYPNPSTDKVTIEYSITEPSKIKITICNSLGQEIKVVTEKQHQLSGTHRIEFNTLNLAQGIYFCKFATNKFTINRKLLISR
ncbi:MAG: T9SS type A sorting domain-containing protein [Bacteroidales bacterium]|nr:T9SS type A sorting domain-containing protein [Bacteroidales bacterium]